MNINKSFITIICYLAAIHSSMHSSSVQRFSQRPIASGVAATGAKATGTLVTRKPTYYHPEMQPLW